MSAAEQIIKEALANDVVLYLKDGRLAYAASGGMPAALKSVIAEHKDSVIEYLRKLERTQDLADFKLPPILPRQARERLALSFSQQRLWFVDKFEGGSIQFNMVSVFRLEGALDVTALERALYTLVERHEALRTVFLDEDGAPVQVVKSTFDLPLNKIDLRDVPKARQDAEVTACVARDANTSFDLSRDTLLRSSLISLSETDNVVVFNVHHIASDGWSLALLVREFSALYTAFSLGKDNPLPMLDIQYADYALWQRSWLQGAVLDEQLKYWRRRLDSIPHVHAVPLDKPRPAQQTWRGKFQMQTIDAELTRRLGDLARHHDATLFIVLQSVFALLVGRYSNEKDVVMGTPVAGRPHKDTEALVGFFVNSLVLRTSLEGNPSFAQYLRTNRQAVLDDYAHQHVPFEMLVEQLRPERNPSHAPIFQIVFGLNNNESRQLELPGLRLTSMPNGVSAARVDLELSVTELNGTLNVLWSYNSDLFVADSIAAMAVSFETLLRGAAADPAARVLELPLLDSAQTRHVLGLGAGMQVPLIEDALVHRAFERQASLHGDSLAVSCGDMRLTYAELDQKASRLACYLQDIGLHQGARIGIYLKRSIEQLIGVLGVMKAGCVYVPLEPAHPTARIEYIINDAAIELVLTERDLIGRMALGGFDILTMEDAAASPDWLAEYADADPAPGAVLDAAESLAYVLYTSGSTGKPKGVMVSHRGACNYLNFAADTYLSGHVEGAVVSSPLCFDATLTTFLAPLFAGKPVLLLPDDDRVIEVLDTYLFGNCNWLFKLTPAHLDALMQKPSLASHPSAGHVIVVGGEQLTTATLLAWKDGLLPASSFVNEYGPTETVVGCSTYTAGAAFHRDDIAARSAVPVGRAIRNTGLFVLNESLQPQPVECIGELYISGAGVARGYVNLPAETEAKFVANPFAEGENERFYRTGDLVRWLSDGNLEFLGRTDDQVKIRGYRIELGEIEGQLRLIDGVGEAAVIVTGEEGEGKGRELAAFIVADSRASTAGAAQDRGELASRYRALLQESLPDYMVPAVIVMLDDMPLTANGKIDRKRLQTMSVGVPLSDSTYAPPANDLQTRLCSIWQELLQIGQIGIYDNFFDLGGHSLLALRFLGRVRDEFKCEVSLRTLFSQPTVASLATVIAGEAAGSALPPIVRTRDAADAPLSFAQQRLWFIDRLQGGSIQYNMPGVFRLAGRLHVDAFTWTLRDIFDRHEILRTAFMETEEGVRQRVRPSFELPLSVLDLTGFPAEEKDTEIQRLCRADRETPFDLTRELPLRISLLRKEEAEHIVVFNMHHIASDGWSMGILVKEFCALYAARVEGRAAGLAELPIQYADYARWQSTWFTRDAMEQGLDYWKSRLADLPEVHGLPLDRPRAGKASYRGAAHAQPISPELARSINELCRRSDVTLSMFLQTAFAVLLGRWSNESDIVIGTTVAGRTHREMEPLIGFFVNSLVLRINLSGNPAFAELLQVCKRNILADFDHQHVPFEALVEALNPRRDMSYSPVFQVAFSLHNNEQVKAALPDLEFSALSQDVTTSHFELVLNVNEVNDAMVFTWAYNSALFDGQTIVRIAESFEILLQQIAAGPSEAIQALPIIAGDDRDAAGLHGAKLDLGDAHGFHQLFARQAALQPGGDAVVLGDHRLSYAALHEKSDRLARYLIDIGIRQEEKVGIYLPRSIEMLIAMLGIAKAGAAYVPLEPEHPLERITYIVEDAGCELVLVDSATLGGKVISGVDMLVMDDAATDDDWLGDFAQQEQGGGLPEVTRGQLAYILYTSGSSGRPKGVMITHAGLLNYLQYAGQAYLEGDIRAGVVSSPLCFDATITSLLVPLCHGTPVILLPDDEDVLSSLAGQLFQVASPLLFKITPAHLEALAHSAEALSSPVPHVIVVGGEQLTTATLAPWRARLLPNAIFINEYGPTETVVGCSTYFVRPGDSMAGLQGGAVPIGQPIANTVLYVMNEQRQLQPEGCTGELYIGGAGVARGYVKLAAMTGERFVTHATPVSAGERLYKTGDLVRKLPGSDLEFIGRADNQVKIRGFRIELGEIESALRGVPAIQDAVVTLDVSDPENRQLVAYATLDKSCVPAAERALALRAQQLLDPEHLYRIGNGMELYGLNKAETEYLYDEIFVHKVYDRHGITVREGDTVFDVGANIGAYSVFLAARFENLKVYSFEPIPTVHRCLEVNAQLFGHGQIVPNNFGLSDAEKESEFSFYPNVSLYSGLDKGKAENIDIVRTFLANKAEGGEQIYSLSSDMLAALTDDRMITERVTVQLSTVSAQIKRHAIQSIDLLKVDVERSELDVLHGIEPQDWPKIKQIVIEVHNVEGAIEYVTSMLESRGFEVVLDQDDDLKDTELFNLYARRPAPAVALPAAAAARWQGQGDLKKSVRASLEDSLPDYMVPSVLVFLDKIPLTHNGKIDYRKLPKAGAGDIQKEQFIAPRSATEISLCRLWASLLKLDRVGVNDNFFVLGGHSLLALRLISHVREEFGVELTIRMLFDHPTVEQLATVVQFAGTRSDMPPITKASRNQVLPLSFAQKRIWFIDLMAGGSLEYNMPASLMLEGPLDLHAARQAIDQVVHRHEVLRTRFVDEEGEVRQVIDDGFHSPMSVIDLSAQSEEEQAASIRGLMQTELVTPFDLRRNLMLRMKVAVLSDDRHFVLFNMHHIASDGWSMGVLLKEFCTLYAAFLARKPDPLPPLPVQYADFACWQQRWLDDARLQKQLDYWKDQLSGLPQLHNLPLDFARPARQTYRGRTVAQTFDRPLLERMTKFCQQTGTTLFMFLETAFAVLLHRYSGQSDIVVGTPIASREHKAVEPLIGCFLNTLVLRTDVQPASSFQQLLLANRESILAAYTNQHVPFEMLVEALKPVRSLSHSPLFQVMFILQNNERAELKLPQLKVVPSERSDSLIKFDLELICAETANQLALSWFYNEALFSEAFIASMSSSFHALIEAALDEPAVACATLPLAAAGAAEIANGRNRLVPEVYAGESMVAMFERQAALVPDEPAVMFGERTLTYQQLNQRANRFARHIRASVAAPGAVIGVLLQRSDEMVAVLLGILKAGCTYLPLDPFYPQKRIEYMIEDAAAAMIVTQQSLLEEGDEVPRHAARTGMVCIDTEAFALQLDGYATTDLRDDERLLDATTSAYLIYTSGSTGQPKAVEVGHGNVANFLASMREDPGFSARDRLLAVTSISFDIHVLEIYLPLVAGGSVVIASRDDALDGDALVGLLDTRAITVMQATPATWKLMLASSRWPAQHKIKMLCGGEPLDRSLADRLLSHATGLWNMYGPTETTVWSSCAKVLPGDGPIVIGHPIRNTSMHVLDEYMREQPPGVYGELYISGAGVAKGYRGRDELTQQRFIQASGFSQGPQRLYRTGDLARWRLDGQLECGGRLDQQVKIRGFRVELREIEWQLLQHAALRDCAVLDWMGPDEEKRLVAYVVANASAAQISEQDLIADISAALKRELPGYMVPAIFQLIDELPLTANGKIDRKALPLPQWSIGTDEEYVAPTNELEQRLVALWEDLLRIDRIGVRDDFFRLGGHSLLATRLISAINKAFQEEKVELSVADVFMTPTVEGVAKAIESKRYAIRMQERGTYLSTLQELEEGEV
jgi:amino acid adenylation domain-containing protein/FkbM family methyltransferase